MLTIRQYRNATFCMKWFSEKNYYVDKKIWKKFEACEVNLIALKLFMMSWY